jgi:hypothetical protein
LYDGGEEFLFVESSGYRIDDSERAQACVDRLAGRLADGGRVILAKVPWLEEEIRIGDRLMDPQQTEGEEARAVVVARKLELRDGKAETTLFAHPVSGVAEVGRWSG